MGVNPLLLSSVGLESGFLVLLLSLLLLTAVRGAGLTYGLVAGAVVLTRMDAAVVVVVLTLLTPAVLRRLHVAVPAALLVVVPWMTWSWFALGSAVPDTVVIKTLQKSWEQYDVHNGMQLYVEVYGLTAVLAFLPVVLGGLGWFVLAALGWTSRRSATAPPSGLRVWPWLAAGIAGLAHYVALSVLGVPPYHWYYAVLVALCSVVAVAALGALFRRRRAAPRRPRGGGRRGRRARGEPRGGPARGSALVAGARSRRTGPTPRATPRSPWTWRASSNSAAARSTSPPPARSATSPTSATASSTTSATRPGCSR